jgi:hypothetical protein
LFCSNVGRPIDFALQTPQILQVAPAGLATPSALVALDCILDLKQLGIVGMNRQSLCNPSQGCE